MAQTKLELKHEKYDRLHNYLVLNNALPVAFPNWLSLQASWFEEGTLSIYHHKDSTVVIGYFRNNQGRPDFDGLYFVASGNKNKENDIKNELEKIASGEEK